MAPVRDFLDRYCSALSLRRLAAVAATLMILSLSAAAGCGDSSTSDEPDASGPDGAPGGDASTPDDASTPSDATPGPDGGALCGGFSGAQCSDKEYCDYPDNECGSADGAGTCKPRPDLCQPVIAPVCGCDGREHENECEAYRAGTDLSTSTNCP